MLTLLQILRSCSPGTIQVSHSYHADAIHAEGEASSRHFRATVAGGDGQHRTTVAFHGAVDANTPVVVSCSCRSFAYNFAFALAARGSATATSADYPIRKNPKLVPGMCGHLIFLTRAAVTTTKAARHA